MAWMTKNLALDLLAILINAGQSAFDRIKQEPEGDWPPAVEQPADEPAKQPVAADTPTPAESKQETPAPAPDPEALLTEAKTLLQTLSSSGDTAWIRGTLLPQFGVAKLSDVPADKLPELIETAKQKQQEAGQ